MVKETSILKTVFITGGIGSGKSSVCRILSQHGIGVYDSDSRTKALYDSEKTLLEKVEKALGSGSLRNEKGGLDRKKLSSIIFSDKDKLSALESIVHPAVWEDFLRWKDQMKDLHPDSPFVVMESALVLSKPLFQGKADLVVLVDAPLETRIQRACRRDNLPRETIIARIKSQEFDPAAADLVLENDSTLEELEKKTVSLILEHDFSNKGIS